MALILSLETATTNCSVSLAEQGRLLALKEENSERYTHSEQLHLFIQEVLREASVPMGEIAAVAVSEGPGSYTGLRIGAASAKGLCFALEIPLIAIPTLENLARQIRDADGLIIPLLDARRMEAYSAVYDAKYRKVRKTEAEVIDEQSFSEWLEKGKVHFLGNAAAKCRQVLEHPNAIFHMGKIPSAREMNEIAHAKYNTGQFEDLACFEPLYLKDFITPRQNSGTGPA